jgi:hypothetical protein
MEARRIATALFAAVVFSFGAPYAFGASYRSTNFVVEAPTPTLAEEIGKMAEVYRHDLAIEWLGKAMPNWAQPCPIHAQVEPQLGAGGATSFVFDHGEVFGWRMEIQGSRERVLDSVLPHEVTHTIFATHFRRPLPRWADEGACTTVEHISERTKQDRMLIQFLHTGRGIGFSQMFAMTEYPQDILPLYSQGYSLARFLIDQKGRREFVNYVGDGLESENWTDTTKQHFGYANLAVLQDSWLEWVKQGSPMHSPISPIVGQPAGPAGSSLASTSHKGDGDIIVRAQSADRDPPPSAPLVPVRAAVDTTVATGPAVFPVRNGSVQDTSVQNASTQNGPAPDSDVAASAVGLAPSPVGAAAGSGDSAEGAAWRGANAASVADATPPAHGGSVYGMGVGMIHRTAESQISTPATDGSAASAASESSAATPNAAALHTSGKPHEVLLEWSKP